MATRVTVGKVADIKPGEGKAVQAGGKTIAVFNVGGAFYAIDDACTHAGGPLSEGGVSGSSVTCPWHGAEFDLKTGEVQCPPAGAGVKAYPVHIEGEAISLEL